LEAAGFVVVGEATDGASALRAAAELRPDVLLLDVVLPDVDGIAVAQRLGDAGPAVVLTSSREASDFGSRLARAGCEFIHKDDLSGTALAALVERRP
jgi:DNA-binding NarL/FixJ family response regulator